MAVKTTGGFMNWVEAMNRVGPDGNQMPIAEVLNDFNELLQDAHMKMANDVFSHLESVRSNLPTVTSRSFNAASTRTSSQAKPTREEMTIIEPWVELDEAIVEKQPNRSEFLANEWMPFGEAAMQEFCRQIIYGDPGSDAREITGLENRSDWDATTDANVVGLSGTGNDVTSLFVIEWGPGKCSLIYPRGHDGVGLTEDRMGKYRVSDSSGAPWMAYGYRVVMEFGITIPDVRAVQRLANIETDGSSNNLLASNAFHNLHRARNRLPSMGRNAVAYVNRDLKSQFDIYADEKANVYLTIREYAGQPITWWQNIPLRMLEAITDETAIS